MKAGRFDFDKAYYDNTYPEVLFTFRDDNGILLNLVDAIISFKIYINGTNRVVRTCLVGSGITLLSAGKFKIDSFLCEIAVGDYNYEIDIAIGNVKETYLAGIFKVR